MAEKLIRVCDWDVDKDVEAVQRFEWTNYKGEKRQLDLCEPHSKEFVEACDRLEERSQLKEGPPSRPAKRKPKSAGPSNFAIIKAWVDTQPELELRGSGRVPFNIEQKWKEAGSPNLLEGQ